ncbi:MAG: TetR/AcrR family transcriptional regulator [Deltaproteobacteria bacterium]|nr:TetR/AcrR family transcriptional regulator [Deltaproteobacteria bacterium]MBW2421751.1 TetR/AcrR family transcriptional regulator [Deltaproteobacteria bacterium]
MTSQPTPQPAERRHTRRGEATAERILDAAEALFAERGFAGTSLRDVAEVVGIRIPSLYNHFDSKATLHAAVLERGIGPLLALLSEFVEAGRDDTYRNPSELIGQLMELLAQRPNLPKLVQYEILEGGETITPVLQDWVRTIFGRSLEMVQSSPAADEWRSGQLPLLMLAFYHVAIGYYTTAPLVHALNLGDPLDEKALARQSEFFSDLVTVLMTRGPLHKDPEES